MQMKVFGGFRGSCGIHGRKRDRMQEREAGVVDDDRRGVADFYKDAFSGVGKKKKSNG